MFTVWNTSRPALLLSLALVIAGTFACKSSLNAKVVDSKNTSTSEFSESAEIGISSDGGSTASGNSLTVNLKIGDVREFVSLRIAVATGEDCLNLVSEKSILPSQQSVVFDDVPAGQYFICGWATKSNGVILPFSKQAISVVVTSEKLPLATLECTDLQAFPGFQVEKFPCEFKNASNNSAGAAQDWKLTGCPSFSMNEKSGQVTGKIPLRTCTATVSVKIGDLSLTQSIKIQPRTKLKAVGKKDNAPALDSAFGVQKISGKYWAHGPMGIHIFNDDLSLVRRISRLDNGLPSDRVDSMMEFGGKVFAGTVYGLAASENEGLTWRRIAINDSSGNGVYFGKLAATTQKLFALSSDQKLYIINADESVASILTPGSSVLPAGTVNNLNALGDTIYASTSTGVHFSLDQGASWTSYTTPNLLSNTTYEVSDGGGKIFVTTGAGISILTGAVWSSIQPAALPGGFATNSVARVRASAARMIVTTTTYPVYGLARLGVSSNSGATWTHLDNYPAACPVPAGLGSVILENNKIVLSTKTGLTYSTDFGATWNCVSSGSNLAAAGNSGMFRDGDNLYMSSWGHGFWKGSTSSDSWTNTMLPRVPGRSDLSLGHIFNYSIAAAGNEIFFHRWQSNGFEYSSDGGLTFSHVDTTASGMTYFIDMKYIGGRLYGAGHSVGFGYSDDKGQTWTVFKTAQGLPSNIVRRIAFGQGGRIFLATDAGLAFTDDLGLSWQVRTTAQGLAEMVVSNLHVDGAKVYAWGSNNYAVSNDNGETFQTVSLTGKGLATDTIRALTARGQTIYAGLDRGIFAMSVDGGSTWDQLTEQESGMPNFIRDFFPWDDRFMVVTDAGLLEFE